MKKATDIEIANIDTQSVEFQNALKLISYTSQSVFLTGKAGTGKSTFLKYLTATTKKKHVVLAPTGIAAVNAGGQTLHSFFKLPFKPLLPDDPEFSSVTRLRERMKYPKQFVKMLRSLDLIIIDEVSMVRADIIDFIDRLLRVYGGNSRMPFGGKQLLLVGDVFQLEPVITGDTRDVLTRFYTDGLFFFNAKAFQELPIVPIELRKVFRQSDPTFINLLDRVRCGTPLQTDIALLNSHVINGPVLFSDDFAMTIATRRDIVDSINQSHLDRLPAREKVFYGKITGEFPDNSLPTDKDLILKVDAQVVFIKNDTEKRWVNGTIGKIREFHDDEIIVEVEDGTRHAVKEEAWENVKYEYDEETHKVKEIVIGVFNQYPLKLAWALTIHKSQGLTFDRVTVDVGQGAFSGGQSYVALSRCRSLEGLKLRSTINARDIFVNQKVVNFSRTFNDSNLINNALEGAKADDLYHKAAVAFNNGSYQEAIDHFIQAVNARNALHNPGVQRLLKQKISIIDRLKKEIKSLRAKVECDKAKFDKLAMEYVEMAESCREEGWELQSAIANYDKAINLSPDYHLAYLGKGMTLAQMGEYENALDAFNRCSELDKKDYRALYEAGRMVVNNGDIALGMDYLLRAAQRNKKIAAIHLALADGYEKVDDIEQAEEHRRIAQRLNRKSKK